MAHGTSNGLSNGNGGPWWVQVLYRYGIPGFLALALVGFLMWNVSGALANQQKSIDGLVQDTRDLRYYLRGVCLNTAKDDSERAYCLQEPRR